MSHDTTIEPAGKPGPRERKGTVLTDRLCETKVAKRKKYYDRRTRGLYVSITPAGVATFSCNFTDAAGRSTSGKLGVYDPETFKVADARGMVYAMKAKGGAAIGELLRQKKVTAVKRGVTVDQVIAEYVEWMKGSEPKSDEPRRRSWGNVASYLRRYVGTRLGHMIANEVTNKDIAILSDDILFGRFKVDGKIGKRSTACARHMRTAASAMFKWAAVPQRGYVTTNTCNNLDELPEEEPGTRVLTEDEIRTLWHGLDRPDLPGEPRTRLAIKFALVTCCGLTKCSAFSGASLTLRRARSTSRKSRSRRSATSNNRFPISRGRSSRRRWAITNMPSWVGSVTLRRTKRPWRPHSEASRLGAR
jgi:hypothetical protein